MPGASLPGGRLGHCGKGWMCSLLGPGWRRAGQDLVLRGCSLDLPRAKPRPQTCLRGAPCIDALPLLFLSMADCRSQLYSFICLLIYFSSMRLNSLRCNPRGRCSLGRARAGCRAAGGQPQWAALLPAAPTASLAGVGFPCSLAGDGEAGANSPAQGKRCVTPWKSGWRSAFLLPAHPCGHKHPYGLGWWRCFLAEKRALAVFRCS